MNQIFREARTHNAWLEKPNRIPAEEMAARIETMVSQVLFGGSQ